MDNISPPFPLYKIWGEYYDEDINDIKNFSDFSTLLILESLNSELVLPKEIDLIMNYVYELGDYFDAK